MSPEPSTSFVLSAETWKSLTANPPDVQPLSHGFSRCIKTRVFGYVFPRAWSQGQWCILPRCPPEAADVARYSAYICQGSYSSRTAHLHTVHGTTSSCYDVKPQTSLDQMSGQQIQQTSIQLTIGSGGWYKDASIRQQFGTSMIWSSALPVSGLSWSKASLIKTLNSGGQSWKLAFAQRDNTLNSCYIEHCIFLSNIKIPHFLFSDNCSLHLGI